MKLKKHRIIFFVAFLIFILLNFCQAVSAGKAARVLILPFTLHSEKDLSFLKDGIGDMLSTRLTREGEVLPMNREETRQTLAELTEPVTEQSAAAAAQKAGADYVIFGSLTVLGNSVSTDACFFDVRKNKAAVTFYETGKDQSEIISHINRFAVKIAEEVFGHKSEHSQAVSAGNGARKAADAPVEETRKHPEAVWQESVKGQTGVSEPFTVSESPEAISEPVSKSAEGLWKSSNFDMEITGMSLGDTDGDGKIEIVFISEKEIFVCRYAEGRFGRVAELKERTFYRLLSVDVADINKNGIAEIFVTNINSNYSLLSFVLEWDGKEFQRIADNESWYYRVLDIPKQGKILLGQKAGMKSPFSGGVYELEWSGGQYVAGKQQTLPDKANVYGFIYGDLFNDGQEKVIAFSPSEYLRITDRGGNEEWESTDMMGGGSVYVEFPAEGSASIGNVKEMDRFYLHPRILLSDTNKDGKNEVIVVENTDMTRRRLARFRMFKSGHISCLEWEKLGLYPKWKTREISGYISDYSLSDADNDGENELVFSVITKIASILGNAKSFIAFQEISGK